MVNESDLVSFLQRIVNSIALGVIIGLAFGHFQRWRRKRILKRKTRETIQKLNKMYDELVMKNGKFFHPSPPPSSPSDNKLH